MVHDARRTPGASDSGGNVEAPDAKIGASTLTGGSSPRAVQLKVGSSTLTDGAAVQQVASSGVAAGGGGPLPHLGQIQQAFGRHDVGGIEAHVGGGAATATRALGTEAYATGNQVAFEGAPSLHTAAHEAAHVVQQRAGVQLKGGMGRAGDEHEGHADAVADAVVQGRSAEGLLDRYAGGGGGGGGGAAVQAKGGDLKTEVLPRFREQPDKHATVLESLPKGVERDKDDNNVAKVALENAIAGWVVTNAGSFFGPVKALSKCIDAYLELREKHIGTEVAKSLEALTPETSTYGRMAGEEAYPKQLRTLLAGGGSLHEHLLVQQMFVDKIYNKDADQIVNKLSAEFKDLISKPLAKDALKPKDGAIDIGIGSTTYEGGHDDARSVEKKKSNIPTVKTGGLGPHDSKVHGEGTMIRGTDRFVSVESNAFVQASRLILDMPISGTGLSGSATDLFACARLFGSKGDPDEFALATFSFFAKAGAHTFHEVMLMAKATGFSSYVPGNYISAIPKQHREQLETDLKDHKDLLKEPVSEDEPKHKSDGTLHGWKDVLTLDGSVEGWAVKVQAFIAKRFGVETKAVTIEPITDGRSGDMVYKVDVVPDEGKPFKGIFKVFHDADVADTEIQIGEKMKKQGVTTPGNKGVARVEAKDGSASKAGVLFERAEGKSPHELVKKLGGLDHEKDAETRKPLLVQLEKAVVAVAKQLAILHGKATTEKTGRVNAPTEMKVANQMALDVKKVHEKGLYEAHLQAASDKLEEKETTALQGAFDTLVQDNLIKQKLRKSMTHGDANAGNFIVDGDQASIIDVNTGVQSLGPTGDPKKTGAADTGRFLESLRTAYPGALSEKELTALDEKFHAAYLPGTAEFTADEKVPSTKEKNALKKIDDEKAADEKAEVYYRACWVLNQLSHAKDKQLRRTLKERLIKLMPELDGKLVLE